MHILIFCTEGETDLHPQTWEIEVLSQAWLKALKRYDREAIDKIGLDLQSGDAAGRYVAKWGIDAELARADVKRGSLGSMTPFELLRASRLERLTEEEREAFGVLFRSYYWAFKGRSQLTWSPGLKAKLLVAKEEVEGEIGDLSAAKIDPEFVVFISFIVWQQITRQELEAELLILARRGKYKRVLEVIALIKEGRIVRLDE